MQALKRVIAFLGSFNGSKLKPKPTVEEILATLDEQVPLANGVTVLARQADCEAAQVNLMTMTPSYALQVLCGLVRHGENVDRVMEEICDRIGLYGGCDQNGSECSNPICRVCGKIELKQKLRDALRQDMRDHMADRLLR